MVVKWQQKQVHFWWWIIMAPWEVPAQSRGHRPGVGYHPHWGFETVTIAYAGEIEHNDTRGNHGIIFADDVQWMTAGSGLMHNEYMTENFAKNGGTQHMVQLWVDLPAADKMTKPRYQSITKENISEVAFESAKVRVIAWEFHGIKGPAKTFSPIELYDIRFEKSGKLLINLRDDNNTMMLVAAGSAKVNDKDIAHSELVYFLKKVILSRFLWLRILKFLWCLEHHLGRDFLVMEHL